ncbi:MAG: 50S ribosomal protein L32 [Parcubacteria group bacterium GW2011_GWC1_43_11b]|uniref:Large ribosomal subunit protein bL32 n=1 Tax=Candidatus Vogelbacteria bacterium RIFOXYB1_FULL_42_16 TaxID=1802436 RepID=A0A1G2QGW4_9BACT|nr:MAG: 50S ribosomal protein L32 [Parcubacteria group bacterium GW2011_GWB1_42_9]KKS89049.1 MAG: 50S ribosomal protein L32 [Parcubacteria group bacterium GW2011_GWC1_43_11b]OHA59221.1 MAG: 50S ribosomal protein L32 [Candidatus Vogelbacteria bacterium RIFOXYB1_FULL_42_16]
MVVRMRHTRAHTGNRRSHHALVGVRLSVCAKCGAKHTRHRACANCGTYKGQTVIDTLAKTVKKERQAKKAGKK